MSFENVQVELDATTTTITLSRPQQRNTLSAAMMADLTAALREAGRGPTLAVVIAAQGPVFSAGHNFAEMAGADLRAARDLFIQCTELMRTVRTLPQPVVARVHALATAAGCQLVAACDLAVAASSAGFALPGGRGGLFCHTPLVEVARNVGRKRAMELAMTGDVISADTAAQWGLVNRVVPDEQLGEAVADLVARVTRGSAYGRTVGKQTFYAQIELEQRQAYDLAVEVMAAGVTTWDAQEGIAAFLDKRPAQYRSLP